MGFDQKGWLFRLADTVVGSGNGSVAAEHNTGNRPRWIFDPTVYLRSQGFEEEVALGGDGLNRKDKVMEFLVIGVPVIGVLLVGGYMYKRNKGKKK